MKILSCIIVSYRRPPALLVSTEMTLDMPQGYVDFKKLEKYF